MKSGTWTVAEAKAKFSELIERARSRGPQTITRNGHTAVVVVSAEEWSRKTKRSEIWLSSSRYLRWLTQI